jgi:predicted amidohydrolase
LTPKSSPSDGPLSIAVAQTSPAKGDVAANVAEHIVLAGIAASHGARLVLFPELSLTGYEIGLARNLAFAIDDTRLAPLEALASEAAITLVVGAPIIIASRLHIGAFIIEADGNVSVYTKRRLGAFGPGAARDGTVPPAEAVVFEPGVHDPLVEIAGTTAAVAICADVGDPVHAARAAARGASTYLASMFVIPSEFDGDSARLAAIAAEHSMVGALANFGAPSGGLAAAGGSSIWSGSGELLVRLGAAGSGVAVATRQADGWRTMTHAAARPPVDSTSSGAERIRLL